MTTAQIDMTAGNIPMTRLASAELRKAINTRAGRWILATVAGICLLVVAIIALFVPEGPHDYNQLLTISGSVLSLFLPIIAIMLVTQEWGQRTGLVTFTLEPRRGRVVIAKFIAGIILSIVTILIAMVLALLGSAWASGVRGFDVSFSVDAMTLRNLFLSNIFIVFVGFAIALLVRNTAISIVVMFLWITIVPTVFAVLGLWLDWFEDLAPWIEANTAQAALLSGDGRPSAEEWAQMATSGMLWLGLPLFLGISRLLRSEIK